MAGSWQYEKGHLGCQWCVTGTDAPYNSEWMQESSEAQGSYLPPRFPTLRVTAHLVKFAGSNQIRLTEDLTPFATLS